jgi:predicted cobalt transporter CbtA
MIAGAVATSFQIWRVTPLILAAEVYENQSEINPIPGQRTPMARLNRARTGMKLPLSPGRRKTGLSAPPTRCSPTSSWVLPSPSFWPPP